MSFLIILLFGFAVMWLLIVLPQRRRQRAHEEMVGKLRPGDYVLTAGGLYGTVLEVGDDDLGLEVSPDIEVRVAKRAVTTLVPPDQIEDVEIDDEPEPIQGERG
ncbi:MAG: preprotein translocase subunit YajC [Gaiellaceae bacterium]